MNMEEVTAAPIDIVSGALPTWLDGTWYINGPALHNLTAFGVELETGHFFDGLAGITAVDLHDGSAKLTTRLLETETLMRLRRHAQYDSLTFGTPMSWASLLRPPFGVLFDNAPINLYPAGDGMHLVATSDGTYRHALDMRTLAVARSHTRDAEGPMGAAHPGVDADTGEIYNYVGPSAARWTFARGAEARYALVREWHAPQSLSLRREVLARVWAPPLWLSHSVALTRDWALYRVLSERPAASLDVSVLSNFLRFDAAQPVQVFAVHRRSRALRRLRCDASFSSFHTVNAFQAPGGRVVVDAVSSDTGLLNDRTDDVFREGYRPTAARQNRSHVADADAVPYFYKRCVLLLATAPRNSSRGHGSAEAADGAAEEGRCLCRNLFRFPFELPTVNPLFRGRAHRFVWAAAGAGSTLWSNRVVRFDLDRVSRAAHASWWDPPAGFLAGEPRMVPRPGAEDEDDGVLLVVSTHETREESRLSVLDARSMREVARGSMPVDLPLQAHGVFRDRARGGKVFPN